MKKLHTMNFSEIVVGSVIKNLDYALTGTISNKEIGDNSDTYLTIDWDFKNSSVRYQFPKEIASFDVSISYIPIEAYAKVKRKGSFIYKKVLWPKS
jgi:hypothetical protein